MAAIYRDDPRFGTTLAKTSCPRQRDICDNGVVSSVLSISNGTPYTIPKCSETSKFKFTLDPDESTDGCCVVDTSNDTCGKYVPVSATYDKEYHNIGIQFSDVSLNNPAMIENTRPICHSAPIRARTIKLDKFFITISLSTLAIIGAALMGGCYEFWFKYGSGEVKGNGCYRIEKTSWRANYRKEELSPIEWSFPTNIQDYPYTLTNGTTFDPVYSFLQFDDAPLNANSTFWERARKSVIAIYKALQINFLLTLIFSRKLISFTLTAVSKKYDQIHPIAKHLAFLLITGILFYIIAEITGIQQWNIGIGFIFFLLLILSLLAMCLVILSTNCMSYFSHSVFNESIGTKIGVSLNDYHELFSGVFYPVFSIKDFSEQVFNTLKNMLLGTLSIITGSCAFGTGFIGAILGLCYMVISLFCNIFFVPLFMGSKCLFTIITEHSDLLIILFCLSIVISSHLHLNSTTTIVIALLVGIIVLYKMYTVLNSKSK